MEVVRAEILHDERLGVIFQYLKGGIVIELRTQRRGNMDVDSGRIINTADQPEMIHVGMTAKDGFDHGPIGPGQAQGFAEKGLIGGIPVGVIPIQTDLIFGTGINGRLDVCRVHRRLSGGFSVCPSWGIFRDWLLASTSLSRLAERQ